MKATKFAGAALLALVSALMLLPGAASAASSPLILEQEGVQVSNGSPAAIGLGLGECGLVSTGTVAANDAATDKITASHSSSPECPAGESISGVITEESLSSKGKGALIGTITLTKPGPCVYEFKKWKGAFEIGGFARLEGKVGGKLNKLASNKTKGVCAKKESREWYAPVSSEPFSEPFEAVL
jgi:hypothetical protein